MHLAKWQEMPLVERVGCNWISRGLENLRCWCRWLVSHHAKAEVAVLAGLGRRNVLWMSFLGRKDYLKIQDTCLNKSIGWTSSRDIHMYVYIHIGVIHSNTQTLKEKEFLPRKTF